MNIAKQLFGVVAPTFKYRDDEQDLITVTSDMELREAITIARKNNSILRVIVAGNILAL